MSKEEIIKRELKIAELSKKLDYWQVMKYKNRVLKLWKQDSLTSLRIMFESNLDEKDINMIKEKKILKKIIEETEELREEINNFEKDILHVIENNNLKEMWENADLDYLFSKFDNSQKILYFTWLFKEDKYINAKIIKDYVESGKLNMKEIEENDDIIDFIENKEDNHEHGWIHHPNDAIKFEICSTCGKYRK